MVTGRDAHNKLIELADLVSEVKEIKHPFNKGVSARKEWSTKNYVCPRFNNWFLAGFFLGGTIAVISSANWEEITNFFW